MVDQSGNRLPAVIVDDHVTFARGLQLLLNAFPASPLEILAVTDRADQAADVARDHSAAVALVDLQMPPPGGLEAIAALRRVVPGCCVIVLSGLEDPDMAAEAIRTGASGYLLKSSEPEDLVPPIRSVLSGMLVAPEFVRPLLVDRAPVRQPGHPALGDDDLAILRMLADGADTSTVARSILVSERTAKRLIANLLRRLGVGTRIEAAVLAARSGLLDDPGV